MGDNLRCSRHHDLPIADQNCQPAFRRHKKNSREWGSRQVIRNHHRYRFFFNNWAGFTLWSKISLRLEVVYIRGKWLFDTSDWLCFQHHFGTFGKKKSWLINSQQQYLSCNRNCNIMVISIEILIETYRRSLRHLEVLTHKNVNIVLFRSTSWCLKIATFLDWIPSCLDVRRAYLSEQRFPWKRRLVIKGGILKVTYIRLYVYPTGS